MAGNDVDDALSEVDLRGRSLDVDLDDAFSEGGDELEFTSAAIREELAKTRQEWPDEDDDHTDDQTSTANETLNSISTLDIGTPEHVSASFTSASIPSTEPSVVETSSPSQQEHESTEVGATSEAPPHNEAVSDRTAHYPAVVIDASANHHDSHISNGTAQHRRSGSAEKFHARDDGSQVIVAPPPAVEPSLAASPSSPSSPSYPLPAAAKGQSIHRPAKSAGPSALEKVVSRTRPSFLPPKNKEEDNKHLADWENMMQHSRIAEEAKRRRLEERRLAREAAVEESIHLWESEIIPNWRAAAHNPRLRRVLWNGVPPKLREQVWKETAGNALALSKDTYRSCLARAKRALASNTFPTTSLNLIDTDIQSTFPSLRIFVPPAGPLYQDLRDFLCAWMVSRSDEGLGYVTGASKLAAMFLLNMGPQVAFVAFRNLLERHCMRSFYGGAGALEDVEAYYRIFDTLLADCMPKIYFNFKQHLVSPAAYLPDWVMTLFLDHLPFEACARLWDVILLEGDSFIFRAALAVLAVLEPRLFFPDRKELLELIHGESKAALAVALRSGQSLQGGKYEIYGLDEDVLWEKIEELEDWWKDSTWSRLIQRELPDL